MRGAVATRTKLSLRLVVVELSHLEHLVEPQRPAALVQPLAVDRDGHVSDGQEERRRRQSQSEIDDHDEMPVEAGEDLRSADGDSNGGDHPPAERDIKPFAEGGGVSGAVRGHD
jgi:hypothetical protein